MNEVIEVPVEQIPIGSQFAIMRKPYRGKKVRTPYTVLSHYDRLSCHFVGVRSDVQGEGSFSFGTLVEPVES